MGIGLAQQAWAVEGARIEGVESGAAAPSLRQSGVERNAVPKATASKAPAAIAAFASSAGYGTLHASTPRKEGRTLGVSTSPHITTVLAEQVSAHPVQPPRRGEACGDCCRLARPAIP